MIGYYIKNYQIILCFFAKLFRCGVVADIHIQHYPTYQIQLRMNSATMAAAPQPTAANPATPILVENAWNHRLKNVQMLPQLKIN